MKNRHRQFYRMADLLLSPQAASYIKQANELAVELSQDGDSIMVDWLVNRIDFLTEPRKSIPPTPQERFRKCLYGSH